MSLLLVGGSGWGNVGDDIVAQVLAREMGRTAERPDIVGGPLPPTVPIDRARRFTLDGSWRSRTRVARAVARASHVVIGGGGLLDDRMPHFHRQFTRVAALCRWARTPYSLVGIGVGPVRTEEARRAYAAAALGAHQVIVRDDESRRRLLDCAPTAAVQVADDPAVWEESGPTSAKRYRFAVNLRHWVPQEGDAGQVEPDAIVEPLAAFINAACDPTDEILLFSMSVLSGDSDAQVLERLGSAVSARAALWEPGSGDIRAELAAAEAAVSMRLHGCLIAYSAGVPTVGLNYDPKVSQAGRRYGFEVIGLGEPFDASTMRAAVERAAEGAPRHADREPMIPRLSLQTGDHR